MLGIFFQIVQKGVQNVPKCDNNLFWKNWAIWNSQNYVMLEQHIKKKKNDD